jgi:hypothetical protein
LFNYLENWNANRKPVSAIKCKFPFPLILHGNIFCSCKYYHVYVVCDYRRGLHWWMDLLTTYTHNSELQAITAPSLISTIHKTPAKPFPACCVFTSYSLSTASNSGDSSASHAEVLSSQPPAKDSTDSLSKSKLLYNCFRSLER